jgi:hypothetical protein
MVNSSVKNKFRTEPFYLKQIYAPMKKTCILTLFLWLSITYTIQSQNKRPDFLGKPSYATLGGGVFFDQSIFLRFSYEQRMRKHFGIEAYLTPSLPLGISSQFRMLHHFGTVSNANYTNFDPYFGGSIGLKIGQNIYFTGLSGVFTGFRIMPQPEYGFYIETGLNFLGSQSYKFGLETQIQVGICRKFLNKKPI